MTEHNMNFVKDQVINIMQRLVQSYEKKDGMLRNFPNHEMLTRKMQQALINVSKLPVVINPKHGTGETFIRVHHMGFGDVDYVWSIPVLEQLAQKYKPNLESFNVADLIEFVSTDELDKTRLLQAIHNTKPIYIIEYECPPYRAEKWVVDGNHRTAARYIKNRTAQIQGFCFPSTIHMEAFVFDYNRVAYAIQTNINRAFGYCLLASNLGYFPSNVPKLLPMD